MSRRHETIVLVAILLVAAALRLVDLRRSPPGLHQDEAVNAWNAYCLLETGMDQAGVRWPIFYTRAIGDNRSTLFIYTMLPFQALGGLNVWTTRLPAAMGGILSVWLLFYVGSRLFDRRVGLVAAALLAVSPWHLQLTRWGLEASQGALLALASMAAILWAGFPLRESDEAPRPWKALVAGVVTGVSCYGYPAIRIFLPVFLLGAVVVTGRAWIHLMKSRAGIAAVAALALGLSVTFGPLAWKHVTDHERIGRRGEATWVWESTDTAGQRIEKVLERYAIHFGPGFLFFTGDTSEIQSPPGSGEFYGYEIPLLLAGLFVTLRRLRRSRSARVLLVWVLAYPAGDCLSAHDGVHALRSFPGIGGLVLVSAVGAVAAGSWLWERRPAVARVAAAVFSCVAIAFNVRYLVIFFGEFNYRPTIFEEYHSDLVTACEWLAPRLDSYDAVFITSMHTKMPYAVALAGLGYDPSRWFAEPRREKPITNWLLCTQFGKLHFIHDSTATEAQEALKRNGRPDRVLYITRPGETRRVQTVREIPGPDGRPSLVIAEATL